MSDQAPEFDFDPETDREPNREPDEEPVDRHQGPLDDPEDGRWLDWQDERRQEAERRLGRMFFDQDEEDT